MKQNLLIGKVLEIEQSEDVLGIVGRMQVMLDFFATHSRYTGFIPFLQTYFIITKTVALRMHADQPFQNPKALQKLDVYFANLYFQPLRTYLKTGKAPSPWKTYFEYCSKPGGVPFLQMLLGINSHINGDLAKVVKDVGYHERRDFLFINKILQDNISSVMSFLAFHEHDSMGLGALVFKDLVHEEFRHVIVKWREAAWNNAWVLQKTGVRHKHIVQQTEQVALELIDIFAHRYDIEKAPEHIRRMRALTVSV